MMSANFGILIAGALGLSLLTGPLGCFILWKRMAYFCESLTHSALLGIALGVIMGLGMNIGIILSCLIFASLLVWLQSREMFTTDALLGILAHAALAIGVITLSILGKGEIDLHDILLGNFSAINADNLWQLFTIAMVSLIFIAVCWRQLLLITLCADLAKIERLPLVAINLGFMLLASLTVAVSVQIAGMLLLTSLLIIPAASAKLIAKSPLQMVLYASGIAGLSSMSGILLAKFYLLPLGASIVVMTTVLFILIYIGVNIQRVIDR
jgi:zinc transport system permease protein